MQIDELLNNVRQASRVIDNNLNLHGSMSLAEYASLFHASTGPALQSAEDFLLYAREYAEALFDRSVAEELDRALRFPLLNTANHHGVDYFPPSVQGNLLFWKALKANGVRVRYLPVCSFGIVSLSNSSYARGITSHRLGNGPIRIPIYPKSMENRMVRFVLPYTEQQIRQAMERTMRECPEQHARKEIIRALEKYYLDPTVLRQNSYGDQAVHINRMLTADMFPAGDIPQIIYLEMEKIMQRLLLSDLENEKSLLHRLLFDKSLHRALAPLDAVFFWGADEERRRFALELTPDGLLQGKTLSGTLVTLDACPESLAVLLKQERIVLSGYTMAVMLCFARGYTWLGGYFQGDYLPEWQRLTARALLQFEEYRTMGETILHNDCRGYVSGPIFAVHKAADGEFLVPSGPLELIAGGGLSEENLDAMLAVTLDQSHRMGLACSYPELVRPNDRQQGYSSVIGSWLWEHNPMSGGSSAAYRRGIA